ncbi:hypothetical protein [Streptomyces montanisoli]|uniref:Uncharacterized protein n=1 Tax=Streptomyces montanisoli TaxID=2798581 RepID=A0A940MB72_9ACTN|nr:hypothetical protein [Streptomyces montanisoli]MBP0456447.1 hypothetical protein [Streptomyces montanisoli]
MAAATSAACCDPEPEAVAESDEEPQAAVDTNASAEMPAAAALAAPRRFERLP